MNSIKLTALFFYLVIIKGYAQYTEVINSNRPGVSRSAFSVGTKVAQFEVGPYIIKEKRTPNTSYEVNGYGVDFAARYGLFWEQLELNIEGTYQNDEKRILTSFLTSAEKRSNFKTVAFGAKFLIFDPYKSPKNDEVNLSSWKANHKFKWRSLVPAIAIQAGANYDTEDNPYTEIGIEGISPRIMIATQNNFPGGWVFVMNLIKDRIGTDQSDFSYILTLTHSFSPKWVIYGETQGIKSDFYADNLFRFGGAYLWSKDFQVDTAITLNAKDTPSVFSANFGMSYRLDFHKDKLPKNDGSNNGTSAKEEGKRRKNRNKQNQGADNNKESNVEKTKKHRRDSIDFN